MFLELTGTGGASTNVIVPTNTKLYFIYNNTNGAITVKTGGSGVSVPSAAKTVLMCNSVDITVAENYLASLTLGAALPVASGGTGATSTTAYAVYTGNSAGTGFTPIAPSTSGNLLTSNGTNWASTAPTAVTTFSAGTTGLTPSTGTSGAVTLAGTLAVANGGTGSATIAANNVILGNGTSAVQVVAPSTSGNVLSSNGSTWQSLAPALKAWVKFNGSTGVIAASYNVTSVSVNATGNYSINFTTPISDANYTVVTGGMYSAGIYAAIALRDANNPATTTTLPINVYQVGGALINIPQVDVAVFR
jgi:hypothetical protein